MLAIHGPVEVSGHGRSNVAISPDSIAVVRNRYDVDDLGQRFVVVLVGGILASAAANSLWPGHLDIIGLGLGIVILAVLIPFLVAVVVAFGQAVVGTASAIARPRKAVRELKRQWGAPHTHGMTDFLAVHDPSSIRLVVDAADLGEVSGVQGWLRPSLRIRLRSGQIHRITAHPWWRRQLTRLADGLRDLQQTAAGPPR